MQYSRFGSAPTPVPHQQDVAAAVLTSPIKGTEELTCSSHIPLARGARTGVLRGTDRSTSGKRRGSHSDAGNIDCKRARGRACWEINARSSRKPISDAAVGVRDSTSGAEGRFHIPATTRNDFFLCFLVLGVLLWSFSLFSPPRSPWYNRHG